MSIGTYTVDVPGKSPIEIEVKYKIKNIPDDVLFCEITAENKEYDIMYKFYTHGDGIYYLVPYEMEEYIKYAVANNGVSFEFADKSYRHLRMRLDYITEGNPGYTMVVLSAPVEQNLIIKMQEREIATLKRRYDELLNNKSAEN
jgi:hypothetical protein